MDDRRIEKIIRHRERGYIWLEKELKWNVIISTIILAVFCATLSFLNVSILLKTIFCIIILLLNIIWHYVMYRREYRNYLSISRYLEEFEVGNYTYQPEKQASREEYLNTGIHAQLTEQLERMGQAFGTLKMQLTEEKENTKGIVTDISHQLKTPIAALELSYELLQDETLMEEERQEFLERGRGEVRRLNHLLGTLMNLSRLEADMIQVCPKECSLKETLVRAVNGIYGKAEEKQIAIEMNPFRDIELLHDSRWTAEAVTNVLDNAVKYSPEGTKIQIRVEPQISYVFIEVEDEGIGIPKSDYQNIFKRFYRGSSPEVEKQEGAGVGLYLVRRILEEQGGSVRAIGARGGGTVIQMMLPKKYSH